MQKTSRFKRVKKGTSDYTLILLFLNEIFFALIQLPNCSQDRQQEMKKLEDEESRIDREQQLQQKQDDDTEIVDQDVKDDRYDDEDEKVDQWIGLNVT